jgi:hypothetical protein
MMRATLLTFGIFAFAFALAWLTSARADLMEPADTEVGGLD